MVLLRRTLDGAMLDLVEACGENVRLATVLLRDMLREHPERPELARELKACEREGDRIAHEIIRRLRARGGTGRMPFDVADGHQLVSALDDVVDYAEQTADWLVLHGVEAPMEQAVALGEVLPEAAEHVSAAVCTLRTGEDAASHLVEINRLENDADRIHRDAVAALFANGIDPMVVIRWKDIYESLEAAVDACETAAHVLEGIALKR